MVTSTNNQPATEATGCCRGLRGPRRNPQPHTGTRLQVGGAGHSDDLDRRQPSLRKGQVLYADMPNLLKYCDKDHTDQAGLDGVLVSCD